MTSGAAHDVVVLGGGLAGLTLALQLRQGIPDLDVVVLERRADAAPDAAFKVGESTVEIGAHYFSDVLGLRDHLDQGQLRKFGFRFFFSDGHAGIDRSAELGVSRVLPTPSWQIDRGRFENMLLERAQAAGASVHMGGVVRGVDLGEGDAPHAVRVDIDGTPQVLHARWVVDASGRAGLLKRQLGLARANEHDVNSAWWRVDGFVRPDGWSEDAAWQQRCDPRERWRSTNHLCGDGYWVWLIPLASGAHSIGIVADQALHPLETYNTHEKAMAWLRMHQPRLATALERPEHSVLDFRFLRHFSHDCAELMSPRRWALTGEAGVFPDPFYSPGSDFIAMANTFITDLVAKDRAGGSAGAYARLYDQLMQSFHANTMVLYQGQYPIFGNALVMPVKVIWDYTYYWSLLAPLAISGYLTDLGMLGKMRPRFERASALNLAMQPLLRAWSDACPHGTPEDGRLLDQFDIGWFREMNRMLHDRVDADAFIARVDDNLGHMQDLAMEIRERIRESAPSVDTSTLDALLVGASMPDAPLLSPAWYARAA